MIGALKKLFAPPPSPIGVDLGTDTIRLAQCVHDGREWQLTAAACADVPGNVREPGPERDQFLVGMLRDLVAQGRFKGRQAILSVPSSMLHIQHVRMPRLSDDELKKALPWELKGKLPYDPSQATLRHVVAGEIQVNGEPKSEVVVMAAAQKSVQHLLELARRAKLEVIGMNVEPRAIVDCFGHVYRRRTDHDVTTCFLDIGCRSTRVTIARGPQILFARSIPFGGDTLSQSVAEKLGMDLEQAKLLRIKLAAQPQQQHRPEPAATAPTEPVPPPQPAPEPAHPSTNMPDGTAAEAGENQSFALLGLSPRQERRQPKEPERITVDPLPADQREQALRVEQATAAVMQQLCDEINLCRRYHEATFAQFPVDRIVFIGGEARQRTMCQQLAQLLGLPAQLGDPLIRMGKVTAVGPESGIDPQQPQPAWAVATGLSMGPVAQDAALLKTA